MRLFQSDRSCLRLLQWDTSIVAHSQGLGFRDGWMLQNHWPLFGSYSGRFESFSCGVGVVEGDTSVRLRAPIPTRNPGAKGKLVGLEQKMEALTFFRV